MLAAAVFSRSLGFGFVEFDDDIYVTHNPAIRAGLSPEGWRWAWTTLYAAFWHPLTWLSLLSDYSLFGLDGRGFHATSVLLHTLNAALLFGVLFRMTGALWRSALAAALFAIHPLRVESVTWIAERKDVLSAAFGLGALWCYAGHVREGGWRRLAGAWGLYVLSLMAKPMLVTLPALLVVLDYWPLRRRIGWRAQLAEKGLFLLPALVFSAVAVAAQARSGAIPAEPGPLWFRAVTALLAAGWYGLKFVWPVNLAPFYPWRDGHAPLPVLASGLFLAVWAAAAWRGRKERPWLAAGLFWYGLALLPVSGIIRVGSHAWADRYTYVPWMLPVFALAWEAGERLKARPAWRRPAAALALGLGVALGAATWRQQGWWADTETLFRRTLSVTGPNPMIASNLGAVLYREGRTDEAEVLLRQALGWNPRNASALNNLGAVMGARGRWAEAAELYAAAAGNRTDYPEALANLGGALLQLGRAEEAAPVLERAVAARPRDDKALANLGSAHYMAGRPEEAARWYEKAVEVRPENASAAFNLGVVREGQGRFPEAARWFARAAALQPADPEIRRRLEAVRSR